MVCVLGEGIRDPGKLMFPDLQECFHLTTSCLTPDSTREAGSYKIGDTCAKSPATRGGDSPERREAEAERGWLAPPGAPAWVRDPGKGRAPIPPGRSREGAAGGWDCPTRGRVSGPRTRPRGAGRGEGTREPWRPALRLQFPGQRDYLHGPSRTWRRQESQTERALNGGGRAGTAPGLGEREAAAAAAWRLQGAARRGGGQAAAALGSLCPAGRARTRARTAPLRAHMAA
ncbi:unnamed protein product [Rangifer tarandus platyrhynchus]|uniref:Uncharacterized protein n=1 Tax=Rangifer tarandus platyrhynchus TaxID=3082113 RepID=A0ABN8ZA86_RANTA|nr:unnamed protein product [Rangifer tarandus platyrhynchus]CAI9689140.1 unnamed protein product [Rangifer tarandus platyrhynchus]